MSPSGRLSEPLLKVGVIIFPGSNCDRDCEDAVQLYLNATAVPIWHQESRLPPVDALILPGGFSYGDYLRTGALAKFSPVMAAVKAFSNEGGPVLGICNGFQILTEAGLLPGVLTRNPSMRFQCQTVAITVEPAKTPWVKSYTQGKTIYLPVAHAEGNYFAPPEVLSALEANGQVVFRYQEDINGSCNHIAGICNATGNVLGMMPHPERALWPSESRGMDGRPLFDVLKEGAAFVGPGPLVGIGAGGCV